MTLKEAIDREEHSANFMHYSSDPSFHTVQVAVYETVKAVLDGFIEALRGLSHRRRLLEPSETDHVYAAVLDEVADLLEKALG